MSTTSNDTNLTVSRIIKAPPDAVWKAWANPEHLQKWWAPAPIVTISAKHEFYAGGGFGTIMRMQNGAEFGGEGCFLEVVENERIVWTTVLEGGWRPKQDDLPFSAIITLDPHSEGTQYTAVALHQNSEDRKTHADMGFVDGWGTCIDQLGELASTLA